jgi:hypothetical protein
MLTSISPVGEATRGQRWWLTATAYVTGAVSGGASVGALAGGIGALALGWATAPQRAALLAVAASVAAGLELAGVTLPSWQRQVDERWLDRYRGWVYGLGFGFQLGTGVMTIAASNLLHVAILGMVLAGSPALGALVGLVYGAARSAPLVAGGRLRSPAALRRVMGRLARAEAALPVVASAVLGAAGIGAWVLR